MDFTEYDTKLCPVVKLNFCSPGECKVLLCCYSQVYSDLECLYLPGSYQWVKFFCLIENY